VKKLKSAKYPKQDFNATLEFVKELDQQYSSRLISYKEVEGILGLKTNATAKFSKNVSTAAQFGLIELKSGTVQITDLGMHILHPIDDNVIQLKVKSLLKSPLYNDLIKEFKDSSLPTVETLANILLNEYRIISSVKLQAAKFFLESLNQLKLQVDGKIKLSDTDSELNYKTEKSAVNLPDSSSIPSGMDDYKISVPLSGSVAQLTIPKEILNDEIKMKLLRNLINANLDVFITNNN